MKRALIALILCLTNTDAVATDYFVENEESQSFSSDGISKVILTCFCSNNIELKKATTQDIKIEIVGELSSVGYHGEQSKPSKVSEELLQFDSVITRDTLQLRSKEYRHLHHAFLIKRIEVYLPEGVEFKEVLISYEDLEK